MVRLLPPPPPYVVPLDAIPELFNGVLLLLPVKPPPPPPLPDLPPLLLPLDLPPPPPFPPPPLRFRRLVELEVLQPNFILSFRNSENERESKVAE